MIDSLILLDPCTFLVYSPEKTHVLVSLRKRHFNFHIPLVEQYPYPEITMIAFTVVGKFYCAET